MKETNRKIFELVLVVLLAGSVSGIVFNVLDVPMTFDQPYIV